MATQSCLCYSRDNYHEYHCLIMGRSFVPAEPVDLSATLLQIYLTNHVTIP